MAAARPNSPSAAITVRGIAAAAGVNQAMISHYFGGKQQLFATIFELPTSVRNAVEEVLDGGGEGIGKRLTRAYLGIWEEPSTRPAMVATFRSAVAGERAQELMRQVLSNALDERAALTPRGQALPLVLGYLLGIAVMRYVMQLAPWQRWTSRCSYLPWQAVSRLSSMARRTDYCVNSAELYPYVTVRLSVFTTFDRAELSGEATPGAEWIAVVIVRVLIRFFMRELPHRPRSMPVYLGSQVLDSCTCS